jgi:hypothetical protein
MPVGEIAGSRGIAFLIGGAFMADIIAKACSSPQTVETNAGRRAETAMKWTRIGMIEGAVFVAIAAYLEPKNASAFIAGGALEAAITYGEYVHAKQSGLASSEPGTEEDNAVYEYPQA